MTEKTNPADNETATNKTEHISSTAGYLHEIFSLQYLQRPRKNNQLTTGIKSGARSLRPQDTQRDGGLTTDSPRGIR